MDSTERQTTSERRECPRELHITVHEPDEQVQAQEQENPRKRARLSCNACKARKTRASFASSGELTGRTSANCVCQVYWNR